MKIKFIKTVLCLLACSLMLSSCAVLSRLNPSNNDKIPGKRESINLQPNADLGLRASAPVAITAARAGVPWSQPGGNAQHLSPHIATDSRLSKLWTATTGRGTGAKRTALAEPLIIGNVVFAMDSASQVSALSLKSGTKIWQSDIGSSREKSGYFGGGLSYEAGRLFVTTGFSQVVALSAKTGKISWRQRLTAPARGAGTSSGGRLFVQTIDNKLSAFNATNGKLLWNHEATQEQTGIIGTAAPSVDGNTVVAAFSSGEVFALNVVDGSSIWQDTLTPLAGNALLTELTDIRANPVIDKGQVILVSNAGRTAVFDLERGTEVWQAPFGGSQTPVVNGNQIFLMGSGALLTAINRDTGTASWQKKLQSSTPKRFSPDMPLAWFGPVLAGNKLLVASAQGDLMSIDPRNGKTLSKEKVGGKVVLGPVGSSGYVLFTTARGRLIAFR